MRHIQQLCLIIIAFISVISSPRIAFYEEILWVQLPKDFIAVNLSLADIALIALLIATITRLIINPDYRKCLLTLYQNWISSMGVIWVLFIVWIGVSQVWALNPLFSQAQLLHTIACLGLVVVVAEMITSGTATPIIMGFVTSAVIQSGIVMMQTLNQAPLGLGILGEMPRPDYEPIYRASGLAMHSNYLAGYLVIGLAGAIWLITQSQNGRKLLGICAGIIGIGIIGTLSRSGYLGAMVIIIPLFIAWIMRQTPKIRLIMSSMLVLGFLFVGIIGFFVVLDGDWGQVQTRFLSGRQFYFEDSWLVITQHPIIGAGAGNIMLAIVDILFVTDYDMLPVHNVYLFIWAELGIIGMGIFIIGCLMVIQRLRPHKHPVTMVWLVLWLSLCTIMLFDNYWWGVPPFRVLMFMVIGIGWGVSQSIDAGTGEVV